MGSDETATATTGGPRVVDVFDGRMRSLYAGALFADPGATLDDLREAVTTLEESERTARRVFGGAHPLTVDIDAGLRHARAALRAREESGA